MQPRYLSNDRIYSWCKVITMISASIQTPPPEIIQIIIIEVFVIVHMAKSSGHHLILDDQNSILNLSLNFDPCGSNGLNLDGRILNYVQICFNFLIFGSQSSPPMENCPSYN